MSTQNSSSCDSLCAFRLPDGRRCRMPRHSTESELCAAHERVLRHLQATLATTFAVNTSASIREQLALTPFEVNTCKKPGERGTLTPASAAPPAPTTRCTPQHSDSLCAFTFRDGRHCRMLRHSKTSPYCLHHQRKLRHLRETDQTASEICEPLTGDFVPATALTHSLTRAFRAVAEGRFDPKHTAALSRLAATLLKSIHASSHEFRSSYRESYWRQLIRDRYNDLPDFIPPAPRQRRPRFTTSDCDSTNSGSDSTSRDTSPE